MCVCAFIRVRPGVFMYVSVRVYNWVLQKRDKFDVLFILQVSARSLQN
jgi:hypothetical protein